MVNRTTVLTEDKSKDKASARGFQLCSWHALAQPSPECSSFTSEDMVLVMESAATSRSLRRFLLVPGRGRLGVRRGCTATALRPLCPPASVSHLGWLPKQGDGDGDSPWSSAPCPAPPVTVAVAVTPPARSPRGHSHPWCC